MSMAGKADTQLGRKRKYSKKTKMNEKRRVSRQEGGHEGHFSCPLLAGGGMTGNKSK